MKNHKHTHKKNKLNHERIFKHGAYSLPNAINYLWI